MPLYRTEAHSGFADAASYDAHRPSFPQASVSALLKRLGIAGKQNADVVDLAAGTGKFTDLLLKRNEKYRVTAIEPHGAMRKVLEAKQWPTLVVADGFSHEMPLEDASVDAVIAAQAFHWFANEESLKEIYRVLRPGGAFGMVWNIEDYNAPRGWHANTTWEDALKSLIWSCDDDQPRFRHEEWHKIFQQPCNRFFESPIETDTERWAVWLKPDEVWDRFSTLSQISVMEADDKERAKSVVKNALQSAEVEMNEVHQIALHGATMIAWTRKLD